MKLVGANPNPNIAGMDKLPGKVNYLRGSAPKQSRIGIPTYRNVKHT
jgi:hypothetical protein